MSMNIVLINPPYQTLTSNLGVGHQVPLGLLAVGGALIDASFKVELIDAEARHFTPEWIAEEVARRRPDVVMTGHAGSTPAHPVCIEMLRRIKEAWPRVVTVYGGVFPTYHASAILRDETCVDVVVRGEGEATAVELAGALARGGVAMLPMVRRIAFRAGEEVVVTPERDVIPSSGRGGEHRPRNAGTGGTEDQGLADLDACRVGWELIEDWDLYQCFGLGRAAIVQFSRGCPHRCTYCGQHGYWARWRHRDPVKVAEEIAWLARECGVRFVTLADENPTTNKALWRRLLEEIAARRTGVQFFATIRATDIVRDADMLDLYKRAGMLYVLLGIDTTDPSTQERVNKRSTMAIDGQACRLLRQHGIRSIAAHIVGLGEETWRDFRRARRVLNSYDADLLNVMYATPHSWTKFAEECADRTVVQEAQSKWDYRHQVLGGRMSPEGLFLAVKWLELVHHLHPTRLPRLVWHRDRGLRRQFRWTQWKIGRVWMGEVVEFVFGTRFARKPKRLRDWLKRNRVGVEVAEKRVQVTVSGKMTDGEESDGSSQYRKKPVETG